MIDLERLLTTADVARILGLSEKTVRRLKDCGLAPIDFGGRFRYRREDVAAFIETRAGESPQRHPGREKEPIVLFPGLSEETIRRIKKRDF